ncbi:MAG: hypothetical protein QGG54_15245, partial [Gammaproteobacteria bacterium]|nr:hypothetical protein [Gammaproteobacteria bacterium]
ATISGDDWNEQLTVYRQQLGCENNVVTPQYGQHRENNQRITNLNNAVSIRPVSPTVIYC